MRISDWSSDVCSSDLTARGAEYGAEQLVAVAGDLVAGKATDRAADQQTGGAIVLLAAITAVAAAPDAGVGTDTLVARIIPVMALLAIEAGILVGLEQARSLRRCGGRKDRKSTRLNSSH